MKRAELVHPAEKGGFWALRFGDLELEPMTGVTSGARRGEDRAVEIETNRTYPVTKA